MGTPLNRRIGVLLSAAALVTSCAGSGAESGIVGTTGPTEDRRSREVLVEYGEHRAQVAELSLPAASATTDGGRAVVVLLHGGFWQAGFDSTLMDPLVPSLLDAGFAVWNIDYRSVGDGGGYPQTFDDVAAAIDRLADLPDGRSDDVDLNRVAFVGHSAGGHLAVWAAGRSLLSASQPGAEPVVQPMLAIAQAGVLDLGECVERRTGGTACADLLGDDVTPERLAVTSPITMVPLDLPVIAVHGDSDRIVPLEQSSAYVEAARLQGADAMFEVISGANHFSMIDPGDPSWTFVLHELVDRLGSGG